MATKKKMLQAAAGSAAGGGPLAIEDVFSTYLYTGNSSARTITNGIDLAGEGGLLWLKWRSGNNAFGNALYDTERGVTKQLVSNATSAETTENRVSSFNSDGFSLTSNTETNLSANDYASWTFRKAPRFFDVVTYTGGGSAKTIAHNLGSAPGCIIVKRTNASEQWWVFHRNLSQPHNKYLGLNTTAAEANYDNLWGPNGYLPTDTEFKVGEPNNISGGTYVAYLYAHDPLGPSGDGSDGLIACGSYTGNGSATGPVVDLGWEPQWVLLRNATNGSNWLIVDNMRGVPTGSNSARLFADSSTSELINYQDINFTSTGFRLVNTGGYNNSGQDVIYIAIRRGPMRVPESGTEVYLPSTATGVITTAFPVDLHIGATRAGAATNHRFHDRLRGGTKELVSSSTASETTVTDLLFDGNEGLRFSFGSGQVNHFFRRAPEFFDVVAYTGSTSNQNINHNLGVVPELIVIKVRNNTNSWPVYNAHLGVDKLLYLKSTQGNGSTTRWALTAPTETQFTLQGSNSGSNTLGENYIAYLFATLAGVSKVFSVTKSSGSNADVNCGFTSGPRFVLLKRTDAAGDWYVWDTARGIVAGDDPYLLLNSTAAEVTNTDYIDPTSNGFTIVDGGLANGDYIGLAIS